MAARSSATRAVRAQPDTAEQLAFERVNPDTVNLRINPFISDDEQSEASDIVLVETEGLDRVAEARRLDLKTCIHEGIAFESEQLSVDEEAEEAGLFLQASENPEALQVVRDLLEELVSRVVQQEDDQEDDREPVPLIRREFVARTSSSTSAQEAPAADAGGSDDGIHPLHSHLLLYSRRYDANQVLYVLTRLLGALRANPRCMVHTLATNNVSASRTEHSHTVLTLLARHRKALLGKNFYQDPTTDEFQPFRNIMFLDMIVQVCSFYLRGCYPVALSSKLTERDLLENKQVQCVAAEILDLILGQFGSDWKGGCRTDSRVPQDHLFNLEG